ncbi:MAG: hypothetical protein VX871_07230 [Pseudomonadota bacterium]|nr:hypothetical protein [Pseudomonadota bacterium]
MRLPKEKDCGFGFGMICEKAVPPGQVAEWVGINLDEAIGPNQKSEPPATVVEALARLDKLSSELPWTSDRHLRFLIYDEHLAYVVGLDQPNRTLRVRTAICRAYSEADLLARAFAAERDDRSAARPLYAALADARKELPRVDEICSWRSENDSERACRREAIRAAESALDVVQEWLQPMAESHIRRGRREEIPKRFFVLRLAEVYALLTGDIPTFHAPEDSSARWLEFVKAALEVVKYPTGTQGLDRTLRSISRMTVHRWAIEDFAERARVTRTGEARSEQNRWARQAVQFGELQSTGLLIDYRVPMPWARAISIG